MNRYDPPEPWAFNFAQSLGRTVAECRWFYQNRCIDFAGDCSEFILGSRLAYFETPRHPVWRFHAAVELSGTVYDLWQDLPVPLKTYLGVIGADRVEYPAEQIP